VIETGYNSMEICSEEIEFRMINKTVNSAILMDLIHLLIRQAKARIGITHMERRVAHLQTRLALLNRELAPNSPIAPILTMDK
jgi:hypothetical protein